MIDAKRYMERKVTLKPCPFCGGRPMEYVDGSAIVIKCSFGADSAAKPGCAATILRHLVPAGTWTESVDSCRAAWNRRDAVEPTHEE